MSKFLKLFNSHLEYQLYAESNDFVSPNVSRCINLDEVHYTPEPQYLIYEASAKLSETTTLGAGAGLHINSFKDVDRNTLTITSHTFENGIGVIKFNGDVVTIGTYAFMYCTNLTSITIPDTVTSIDTDAFHKCSSLTSITIGNSVTSIGNNAFPYCSSLTSIVVERGNAVYDSRNNCNAIIETSTNTLIVGCKNTIIPNSVTSIGISAFSGCSGLTSVTIPNSVTSIGRSAFADCAGLILVISNATTAPSINYGTFQSVKTGGTLYVPSGATGYDTWMRTGDYYLGKYNWTKIEQ